MRVERVAHPKQDFYQHGPLSLFLADLRNVLKRRGAAFADCEPALIATWWSTSATISEAPLFKFFHQLLQKLRQANLEPL